MAIDFRIFPDRGLVYVRYQGMARLADTGAAFDAYLNHPDYRTGQKQLVDLSKLTGIEDDFVGLMKLQAQKGRGLIGGANETLMVYYAPTPISMKLARIILQSWDGIDAVVAMVHADEAEVLSLLGQRETCLDALLTGTSGDPA